MSSHIQQITKITIAISGENITKGPNVDASVGGFGPPSNIPIAKTRTGSEQISRAINPRSIAPAAYLEKPGDND
jgi:hypothetical protein